jgi:hypothetical protein
VTLIKDLDTNRGSVGEPGAQIKAAYMSDSVNIDDISGISAGPSVVQGYDSYKLRLGDLMRGERATLGKSLLDVQRDLRIRATYIAAIENCDVSAFQTPGFIAGYVRSYARYLGLDPDDAFNHFCEEAAFDGVHPGLKPKTKSVKSGPVLVAAMTDHARARDPFARPRGNFVPTSDGMMAQISPSGLGSVLVLLVLIVGLGYGAWAVLRDIQRVEITPLETNAVLVAGVSDARLANEIALDQLYRPKGLDVPVMVPRDGPIAALDPDNIGALVNNNASVRARETAELVAENTPRVTELAAPKVAVVAMRPAWVRLSMADGTILFEKILDSGESFELPKGTTASTLRAGNSGAVYLTLDGRAFGPVGGDTSVVKDIALAPEAIVENFAAVSDKDALKALDSPRVITLNTTE